MYIFRYFAFKRMTGALATDALLGELSYYLPSLAIVVSRLSTRGPNHKMSELYFECKNFHDFDASLDAYV